jgi:hypothetical protein
MTEPGAVVVGAACAVGPWRTAGSPHIVGAPRAAGSSGAVGRACAADSVDCPEHAVTPPSETAFRGHSTWSRGVDGRRIGAGVR